MAAHADAPYASSQSVCRSLPSSPLLDRFAGSIDLLFLFIALQVRPAGAHSLSKSAYEPAVRRRNERSVIFA